MHEHPLTIEIRPCAESVTLALAGELDLASAGTLRACLDQLDAVFTEVVVDVSDLAFVDSTGLALLMVAERALAERGGRLHLHGATGHVLHVLEVSGVREVLIAPVAQPALPLPCEASPAPRQSLDPAGL